MSRQEVIKRISEALNSLEGLETILFGSSARGDYNENSDIDLLILLPDSLSVKERIDMETTLSSILLDIELESNYEISPVILQKKIWNQRVTPFTLNVTNQGILL